MSQTYIFKHDGAPGLGVAVRLREDGSEAWRREIALAPLGAAAQNEICVGERADAPSVAVPGASEAAPSRQFTGGSAEGRAVGIYGQQASPVHSGAQAGEVGSLAEAGRNLGNPPMPEGQGAGVESGPPANLQGDLFAAPAIKENLIAAPVAQVGEPLPAAPFVLGSQTSHAAAVAIEPSRESQAGRVLEWLRSRADAGGTSDEIEAALGIAHQSCGPRIRELEKAGRIIRTERTRLTASGRAASVLVAAPTTAQP